MKGIFYWSARLCLVLMTLSGAVALAQYWSGIEGIAHVTSGAVV
jgi:hypothetical protein